MSCFDTLIDEFEAVRKTPRVKGAPQTALLYELTREDYALHGLPTGNASNSRTCSAVSPSRLLDLALKVPDSKVIGGGGNSPGRDIRISFIV